MTVELFLSLLKKGSDVYSWLFFPPPFLCVQETAFFFLLSFLSCFGRLASKLWDGDSASVVFCKTHSPLKCLLFVLRIQSAF